MLVHVSHDGGYSYFVSSLFPGTRRVAGRALVGSHRNAARGRAQRLRHRNGRDRRGRQDGVPVLLQRLVDLLYQFDDSVCARHLRDGTCANGGDATVTTEAGAS